MQPIERAQGSPKMLVEEVELRLVDSTGLTIDLLLPLPRPVFNNPALFGWDIFYSLQHYWEQQLLDFLSFVVTKRWYLGRVAYHVSGRR